MKRKKATSQTSLIIQETVTTRVLMKKSAEAKSQEKTFFYLANASNYTIFVMRIIKLINL